jgi:hypothetical protein
MFPRICDNVISGANTASTNSRKDQLKIEIEIFRLVDCINRVMGSGKAL